MRITAAGNVGIGTKTPSALLSLSQTNGSSTVTATPIQSITNLVDASASASLAEPFSTWRIGVNRPPDNNNFLDGLFFYSNATRMAITFGGNVGIGTTTPSATLEVKVGGTTLADAWTVRSSRRWKINIEPLKGALKKVDQLRGVSYDRKTDGKHEIGVVAEEVGKVVPEVVTYEKNGVDAQGVDYARLTALLIEATKEQHQAIEKQQAQIDALARSSREKDARIRKLALQVQELRKVAFFKTHLGRVEVSGGNPAGVQ